MIRKERILVIAALMVIHAHPLCADVIAPLNYYDGGISASLEGILSLEYPFSKKTSLLLWFGGGIVKSISHQPPEGFDPTYGIEGSLEFRIYPASDNNSKFFIGLYGLLPVL